MPNVGRPSRDCYECRQRRTKCDLRRPMCGQCMRKNVACSGYRDEEKFRFQVESTISFSAKLGKDRRRLNLIETETSLHPFRTADPGRRFREQQYVRLPAHTPLIQSWDVQAIPFIMKKVKPASDLARGISDVFPHILSREGHHSAAYYSCYAVASACLAQKNRSLETKLLQTKAHSHAIRAVSKALDEISRFRTDGTLLAIWLLGYYELFFTFRAGSSVTSVSPGWLVHNRIITELIRRRGPEQFATAEGRKLFLTLFTNMEMQAYMTGRRWEDANTCLLSFYKYCDPSEYRMLRSCIFCHHCSVICSRIQLLLDAGDLDDLRSNVASILRDVDQVETAISPLELSDPTAQAIMADYAIDPPSPLYPKHHTSLHQDNDDNTNYTATEVRQRHFRMRLSYHVLKLLRHACRAPSCSPKEQREYTARQQQCMDEIYTSSFELLLLMNPQFPINRDRDQQKIPHVKKEDNLGGEYSMVEYTMADVKRYVQICVDLEQDLDDKCTLIFSHTEHGIAVLGFSFQRDLEGP